MAVSPNQKRRGFHEFGTNKVIGVMDDKAKVDAACAALTSIGITDAMIEVFCSLEGERNLDLKGESHGFLDHISRTFEHVRLVDGSHMDRYEKELLAGHCVIQVYTGDSEAREQAKDLLKASGAYFINAYTAWTTEVLVR
jgi:hypothetical protein